MILEEGRREMSKDMSLAYITYTNHRGEKAVRRIRPVRLYFGATAWHPEPQWLLEAVDMDKQETRDFAMSGISQWGASPL